MAVSGAFRAHAYHVRGRRLDDVRRPQILAAALELIRERGLWDVRLADVAKRAGISATSVVYYFGTKDAAVRAGDRRGRRRLLRAAAGRAWPGWSMGVDRIARLFVSSSTSDWPLWMDLWVYSRHHPETAVAQRRFHERWRETIADVVRYGCDTGEWRVPDPAAVALRLSALTDGLAVHMVLGDRDHTPEAYVAMSLAAAALELGCDLGRPGAGRRAGQRAVRLAPLQHRRHRLGGHSVGRRRRLGRVVGGMRVQQRPRPAECRLVRRAVARSAARPARSRPGGPSAAPRPAPRGRPAPPGRS